MPKYQGELDGLCGPYAIANALEVCGLHVFEDAFRFACLALSDRRWPDVLWEGTTLGDLQRMLKRCKAEIPEMEAITITYPFLKAPPSTSKQYWQEFNQFFRPDSSAICAIIGLNRPSCHWIVASRDGSRIMFADSRAGAQLVRKNRNSLHAGERDGNPNRWIIDRKDFILFEMEG